ncbi:aldo/keto reductase [Rhodoblastus acidophilus]|uniref:Aldo/keto reductase n=1 Tax=Candidatus Rhodoblastus alkanivorans TaxID=2954117 RepID=A0ABS9Z7Z1_9HYPH|nr:aldo/keto reductase [Candidatus Rhodoblastus alkanivorans]MCI4677922.1 aldo/keto reductase [Candidatus Rhodoblastus alkanivorans]MCI4683818.1 aldo/keto reductase [Candidatus Rhodoblastus alkanivorans]MDI4641136.1 aldo/keto reductase [Rhodoblastus acidophilus]
MQQRPLGRTDLRVSEICLGTMTYGEQTGEADAFAQMDYAVAKGVNFLDTAELYAIPPRAETYGATETIIGKWLRARGNREKIVLATKIVGRSTAHWYRNGETARLDRKNIFYAVENSLKRLQTDYIDLYQLHWPDRPMDLFQDLSNSYRDHGGPDGVSFEETLSALGELVKQGKIRHFGVSNETPWGVGQFLRGAEAGAGPRLVSIQNAYNLLNRQFEIGLAEFAFREQVGLLAYSPLGQGVLTGKYLHGARPEGARFTLFARAQRYQKPGVDEAIEDYMGLAREFGLHPVHLALAFVTSRPFVTANIIGATTLDQLKLILDAPHKLDREIARRIDAIHQIRGNPSP